MKANLLEQPGCRNRLGPYSRLVDRLSSQLINDEGVVSFWISGSRANNRYTNDSDLDLTIVCKSKGDTLRTKKILSTVLERIPNYYDYKSDSYFDLWLFETREVGINITYLSDLEGKFDALKSSDLKLFENTQAYIQHKFVNRFNLFDKIDLQSYIDSQLSSIPKDNFINITNIYLQRLVRKLLWWKIRPNWKNVFEEISDISVIIEEIGRCHYALNERLFMPGQKEYIFDLPSLVPLIDVEVHNIANIESDMKRQEFRRKSASTAITKLYFSAKDKWSFKIYFESMNEYFK